jgi:hypothetical protein
MRRILALVAVVSTAVVLASCGGDSKEYDISSIFPLSEDKCERYNGDEDGEGPTATCLVSKEDCERAAADWRDSMQSSGVNDAILFTCD